MNPNGKLSDLLQESVGSMTSATLIQSKRSGRLLKQAKKFITDLEFSIYSTLTGEQEVIDLTLLFTKKGRFAVFSSKLQKLKVSSI
jgi:hypothetical protein